MKDAEPDYGNWIETVDGFPFSLSNPRPEDVNIKHIASALGNLCRWTGQMPVFYSVAQHSVHVSHLVPAELAFQGLMHDATEAYIGDLNRPAKQMCPCYQELERTIWQAIAQKFDLPVVLDPRVKHADTVSLLMEQRDLRAPSRKYWGDWTKEYVLPTERITTRLYPVEAGMLFLNRFQELYHA